MIPFWACVIVVIIVGVVAYFGGYYDAKYNYTEKDKK